MSSNTITGGILRVKSCAPLLGEIEVPGDKSISHRALIFGSMAEGCSCVSGLLEGEDVMSTKNALVALGARIEKIGDLYKIYGVGRNGFHQSLSDIDCGNSGTTIRLLMGLLAGQKFVTRLTGDASLRKRPMKRVTEPLAQMGAKFTLTNGNFAPLEVQGASLSGLSYNLKIASAQVKTSLLLAGIYAHGDTILTGELGSRDHTERMLPKYGVNMSISPNSITLKGPQWLKSADVDVPGDPSSAAFWLAAAVVVKGSHLKVKNISLNPTRIGFVNVLRRMGADILVVEKTGVVEPLGDIEVKYSQLQGASVGSAEIPSLIDEVPILAVVASQAHGLTRIRGAGELRVKESDRIETVAVALRSMGVRVETFPDGLDVWGPTPLRANTIATHLDHRIAMSFAIAGLVASGETVIDGIDPIYTSFPTFFSLFERLVR